MGLRHGLNGQIELAIMESVDGARARGVVRSTLTGSSQECILNPSPYMGIMPLPNAVVAIYRKQGWFARSILPIADLVGLDKRSMDERISGEKEEPKANIMQLEPGECYFGRFGRIFMDRNGSVKAFTSLGSQSLTLNAKTKHVDILGNNFSFDTHGAMISIHTSSSVPAQTYGDTLQLEKNILMPGSNVMKELPTAPPIPTNIARIEIDKVGGISLSAAKTSPVTPSAALELSIFNTNGDVGKARLYNNFASLTMSPEGDIDMHGPICELSMDAVGNVILTGGAKSGSFTASTSGQVNITSALDMLLNAGNNLKLLTKSTDIIATPGPVNVTSPIINLNGAVNAGALTVAGGAPAVMSGTMAVTGTSIFTGATTFIAPPILTGLPLLVPLPLSGVSAIAKVPVLVNGVIVGFIPIIP